MSLEKSLVKNSIEAMQCAIELHNKPSLFYRYQTVSILFCNARELLLKAYILKEKLQKRSVIVKDIEYWLEKCMDITKTKKWKKFELTHTNLTVLREYRNSCIHLIWSEIENQILEVILKNIDCYNQFLKNEFWESLFKKSNFYILPIWELKIKKFSTMNTIWKKEKSEFKEYIQKQNERLLKLWIKDSVNIQVNIELVNQRHSSDTDLKISTHSEGIVTKIQRKVMLDGKIEISDKGSHTIKIEDDYGSFRKIYPYKKWELAIVLNKMFYERYKFWPWKIIANIPNEGKFMKIRYWDPDEKKSPIAYYTELSLEFCKDYITKNCNLK